jgi:hypothetical protein
MQAAATCAIQLMKLLSPALVTASPWTLQSAASVVLRFGQALYRVVHCYLHRQILRLHEQGSQESWAKAKGISDRIMELLAHKDVHWLVERGT